MILLCSRCRKVPPRAGKTRCADCAAKDAAENGARYVKRGGHGGRREAGSAITLEQEGDVTRIRCRCGAMESGTFDAETTMEIIAGHRCPLATKRKRVTPQSRQTTIFQGA